ncbi:hypothetical protein WJX74_011017 [Apatococcus lobatus]|uniref:Cornifelin n=2 Tax=Apatococcus TaxID=904362 RepID=A0AAW1ST24_9CHLO
MNVNGRQEERDWHAGLYDCCSGWDSTLLCLQGWLTPCWMFGDNMNLLRKDGCCGPCCLCCHFPCCGPLYAAQTRRAIRQKYGIREGPCSDKAVWACCWCCATCQEAKELQEHEVRKPLVGNTTQQATSTVAPPVQAMGTKPATSNGQVHGIQMNTATAP